MNRPPHPAWWALLAALYLIFLNPHFDIRAFNAHDPATYLLGARSIAQGAGYGLQFADVFEPMKLQPPGMAALLAPVVGVVGFNFTVLKLMMVMLAAVTAGACYALFRHFLASTTDAAWATLLLMASPTIFGLSHQVLADIPLILCSVVALLALDRYLRQPAGLWSPWLAAAAASTAGAYFFKGLGLAVLVGGWLLLLSASWRCRKTVTKLALYTVLVVIPIAAWQWRCALTPSIGFHGQFIGRFYLLQEPYTLGSPTASLADLLIRMRHNIAWGMAANAASILFAPLHLIRATLIACFLALPVVGWLVWHWLRSWRERLSVLEGFTLVGMIGLVLYIHGYTERFVAWLFPAFLIYAFRGFAIQPRLAWLPRACAALSLVVTVVVAWDQWRNPYGAPTVRDYVAMADVARNRFGRAAWCLAPMESHWQVLTNHACLAADLSTAVERAARQADYTIVLADPAWWRQREVKDFERDLIRSAERVTEAYARYPGRWKVIASNRTFQLAQAVR